MNYRVVFGILGRILTVEAALMALPAVVALIYRESPWGFFVTMLLLAAIGVPMSLLRERDSRIYAREGFFIVGLSWVLMSLFGALPFVLSGAIPSYVDAVFEIVSGFTTTGASILTDVEAMPKGLLFWRSFTHWIGGMGVLVFVMAIVPLSNISSMHIMRAEVPGPTKSKLVPKMKSTAMILYGIYIVMTVVEIIMLVCGGMSLYDALINSFGSAGTGGFSHYALSIGHYNNPYFEMVIAVFMLLFGVNFNLYYLLLLGNVKSVLKSEELRAYLGIMAACVLIIALSILNIYGTFSEALRYAFFQASSVMTTTGYATADFNLWPSVAKFSLVILMLVGASAGSTGGGMKVSRCVLLVKSMFRNLKRLVSPRSVNVLRLDGAPVDELTVRSTEVFFSTYIIVIVFSSLLVSIQGFDLETTVTSVIACVSNIGPGLGLVGPMGSFAIFAWPLKVLLSLDMLIGRLELFPMLLLFTPKAWRK